MTRSKKQTVDYFPHTSVHKKTMFILEQKYGNDGYAFWFKLLEMLASTDGHYLDCSDANTWEFLQAKTRLSGVSCGEILDLLARLDAIDGNLWQDKIVWSQNFVDWVAPVYSNRRVDIPSRPASYKQKPRAAKDPTDENPQSREEESREEESKRRREGRGSAEGEGRDSRSEDAALLLAQGDAKEIKGIRASESGLGERAQTQRSCRESGKTSHQEVRVSEGSEVIRENSPPSESESEESLSEGDREVIAVWRSVKGFRMPAENAATLVADLRREFPEVDLLQESKTWAARKLSEPLTMRSKPSGQLWSWMRKAREFTQERRQNDDSTDKYLGGKYGHLVRR